MNEDKNFGIITYESLLQKEWDEFIDISKNGTFMLKRNYMDYHADRFNDMSLMIYRKGKLFALLPGNRKDDKFYSHQGLTYGGLIMNSKMVATECIEVFKEINTYLKKEGITSVVYKPTPYIYHKIPSEEDLYALFVSCNAKITVRCISSTIYEDNRLKFIESRKSGIRKAVKNGLIIEDSSDIESFWEILNMNLMANHATRPVHSAEELKLLKTHFPLNIKLYVVKNNKDEIIGGTLIYVTDLVIHTQYISANEEGKFLGALDLLFDFLINDRYTNYRYFDFGHSTEERGQILNNALIFQKEGFGGGACVMIYTNIIFDNNLSIYLCVMCTLQNSIYYFLTNLKNG